jgi:hypothetical protein
MLVAGGATMNEPETEHPDGTGLVSGPVLSVPVAVNAVIWLC